MHEKSNGKMIETCEDFGISWDFHVLNGFTQSSNVLINRSEMDFKGVLSIESTSPQGSGWKNARRFKGWRQNPTPFRANSGSFAKPVNNELAVALNHGIRGQRNCMQLF